MFKREVKIQREQWTRMVTDEFGPLSMGGSKTICATIERPTRVPNAIEGKESNVTKRKESRVSREEKGVLKASGC
jgi:hypothetical protein